jgi:hypothetical protein
MFWLEAVSHACNPGYFGGGDWEDHGSRPAGAKSSQDPISTNGWVQWCVPVIQLRKEAQIGGQWSRLTGA